MYLCLMFEKLTCWWIATSSRMNHFLDIFQEFALALEIFALIESSQNTF